MPSMEEFKAFGHRIETARGCTGQDWPVRIETAISTHENEQAMRLHRSELAGED